MELEKRKKSFNQEIYIFLKDNFDDDKTIREKYESVFFIFNELTNINPNNLSFTKLKEYLKNTLNENIYYIKNNICVDLIFEINNLNSLFEFIFFKHLNINYSSYNINIEDFLNITNMKNLENIEKIENLIEILKNQISENIIYEIVILLNNLYLPNKLKILERIISNLVFIQRSNEFEIVNFDRDLENLKKSDEKFLRRKFNKICQCKRENYSEINVFHDEIFFKNYSFSRFIEENKNIDRLMYEK